MKFKILQITPVTKTQRKLFLEHGRDILIKASTFDKWAKEQRSIKSKE